MHIAILLQLYIELHQGINGCNICPNSAVTDYI